MAFPVDDVFPPPRPATFGARRGSAGIIWHTTEAAGTRRADAVATATWQRTNPGSYNWIVYDPATDPRGLLLTVPYLEASGGVNPASAAWAPGRFPWLRQLLPAAAYADPNAHLLNVAFSGRTADLLKGLAAGRADVVRMVDVAARLTLWVEAQAWGADDQVFSGHMHWQSNRSDPGQAVIDAILARYAELKAPKPAPPPPPDYRALYEAEVAKVADLRVKLQAERDRITRRDAYVRGYPGE